MTSPQNALIALVWAQTVDGVIGRDGDLPWHLPEDMAHFKAETMGHPVVMGRRTWASIPPRFRPFAGRTNIVLTSDPATADDVRQAGGIAVERLDEALDAARAADGGELVCVIGGGQVFAAAVPLADTAVVTVINAEVDGDTYAPALEDGWELAAAEPADGWRTAANGTEFRIERWRRTAERN
ncbi:dihydrofolate reductase [Zhihengliuella sp.]|uniref:dihydrofolate reductase n=1 Tax=Zhihengliuella sp. TaxID=1954483 RepID=UPI00281263B7|nr:dihydrofolate reductase [Zhihengliuella sp.]